jgi:hypothetical protein
MEVFACANDADVSTVCCGVNSAALCCVRALKKAAGEKCYSRTVEVCVKGTRNDPITWLSCVREKQILPGTFSLGFD